MPPTEWAQCSKAAVSWLREIHQCKKQATSKPGTEAKDNQANENGKQKAISHQGAHEYKGILAFSPQQIGTHITLLVHAAFCEINLRVGTKPFFFS